MREDLSGPIFPKGFEGDDDPIDLGSYIPATDADRQLYSFFDVRLSKEDQGSEQIDPDVPKAWFSEPGFITAIRYETEQERAKITEQHMAQERRIVFKRARTPSGFVRFAVVYGPRNPGVKQ